ncbi:MAG: hypothetical protein B6242_17080 [Anaerolineaceae bacterium 4572_78]|nr:MAG: hypothetical protein B6242_17080 [Anaerolineaceae bacterium 4572_78]
MSIKFLLDENMPFALVDFLTRKGYETNHIKTLGKTGIKNGEVYRVAEQVDAWIVTRDADFKNYHKFITHNVRGVIVFSIRNTTTQNVLNVMNQFLEHNTEKLLSKHLIIIEDEHIKIYGVQ